MLFMQITHHHSMNSMVKGNLRGEAPSITTQAVVDNIVDILVIYTPQAVTNYAGGR
jgi:hypothetical protein